MRVIWTDLEPFAAICSQLDRYGKIWTQFDQLIAILSHLEPFEAILEPFGAIWNHLVQFEAS